MKTGYHNLKAAFCTNPIRAPRAAWLPVLIHWSTVVIWLFFLGNTNIILAFMVYTIAGSRG